MVVSELIKVLSKMNQDAEVAVKLDWNAHESWPLEMVRSSTAYKVLYEINPDYFVESELSTIPVVILLGANNDNSI